MFITADTDGGAILWGVAKNDGLNSFIGDVSSIDSKCLLHRDYETVVSAEQLKCLEDSASHTGGRCARVGTSAGAVRSGCAGTVFPGSSSGASRRRAPCGLSRDAGPGATWRSELSSCVPVLISEQHVDIPVLSVTNVRGRLG